jgi:hypothetical protein
MMALAVVGRLTVEVGGARVVVGPMTMTDLEAARSADWIAALEAWASHIEEPADATERGMAWVGAACVAWQAAVTELMARLTVPANRAARRQN